MSGDEPFVNEIVVCEVRAGLRDVDVDRLEPLLEPIEFIQPGPESALAAGRWRAVRTSVGTASASPTP